MRWQAILIVITRIAPAQVGIDQLLRRCRNGFMDRLNVAQLICCGRKNQPHTDAAHHANHGSVVAQQPEGDHQRARFRGARVNSAPL